jgi:hypothetical protein
MVRRLTPAALARAETVCNLLWEETRTTRESIEAALLEGGDVDEFVRARDEFVNGNPTRQALTEILEAEPKHETPPAEFAAFVTAFTRMARELLALHDLFDEVTAKAQAVRPIDWELVEEARAAYDRGETVPLRWQGGDVAPK